MGMNTGIVYLGASAMGATYGLHRGFKESPSMSRRILLNSVLNGASRHGGRAGNAVGVLALMYSSFNYAVEELIFPELGLDRIMDTHEISPVFSAALTGALYKATTNSKTIILASVLGG